MKRTFWLAAAFAAGAGTAGAEGFLVFSGEGVTHYAPDAQGRLGVAGKAASGRIEDFLAARGGIYRLEKLIGKAYELGPDLMPRREAEVKSKSGIPYWLGSWEKGLLVLCDNAVLYLDESLKPADRVPLEPRKSGDVTPVLSVRDFAAWDGRGYLLADTGEVFVLPLSVPVKEGSLRAAIFVPHELGADGLWIDTRDRTLNVLASSREEQRSEDLKPGEFRVIKQQRVLAYALADLKKAPRAAIVHERREIHEPHRFPGRGDDERYRGESIERRPPYRKESSSGTYVGIRSRTTPAYAEAFAESEGPLPPRRVVRLGTLGRLEPVELLRDADEGALWFEEGGRRLFIEPDLAGHVLRLQPGLYGALQRLPGLRPGYFKTLAY